MAEQLVVTSPVFQEGGWIPLEHTARGSDRSPELNLSNIDIGGVCLAITLDDSSHPLFPNYNHWLIWNIPAQHCIPANIPHGSTITDPFPAKQGRAYGRHCYKGPKSPGKSVHSYVFTVYVLDAELDISENSKRDALLAAMDGHVLQQATLSGMFQSRR